MNMAVLNTDSVQAFRGRFRFKRECALNVGVERECFLTDKRGIIVPRAVKALEHVRRRDWQRTSPGCGSTRMVKTTECTGFELSASQFETRTPVHHIDETEDFLRLIDINLRTDLNDLGLRALYSEVAPETMPLDIYPDPTGRYPEIARSMPRDVLLAACRIIGTHVHVGMPDHETALHVYNSVIKDCDTLMELGDGSNGERLKIYGIVKPDCMPRAYDSWGDFHDDALAGGFMEDPRSNWRLIRITGHGTIEFRVFGATDRIDRICSWARLCYLLCKKAIG